MVVVRLISVVDWDTGVIDFCERVGSAIAFGACGERRDLSAVGTATWDFNCLTRPCLNLIATMQFSRPAPSVSSLLRDF